MSEFNPVDQGTSSKKETNLEGGDFPRKVGVADEDAGKGLDNLDPGQSFGEEKSIENRQLTVREKRLGYASKILSILGTIGSLISAICLIAGVAFPPIAIIGIVAACLSIASTACNIACNASKYGTLKNAALGAQIVGGLIGIAANVLSLAFPVSKVITIIIELIGNASSFVAGLVCSFTSSTSNGDAKSQKTENQSGGKLIDTLAAALSSIPAISNLLAFLKEFGCSGAFICDFKFDKARAWSFVGLYFALR